MKRNDNELDLYFGVVLFAYTFNYYFDLLKDNLLSLWGAIK